jgi:flagellar FliJ protein
MARRFEFRLETLLRVRQLREREAKRKVAAQRAEIARLDRLDRQTADEISRQQAELLEGQRAGRVDPLTLQRGRAWIGHLRRTIALRQVQRTEMLAQLQQLQGVWRAARTQARIIEKLRERRWEQYVRDRARKEQAAADELAQQLHARNSTLEIGS